MERGQWSGLKEPSLLLSNHPPLWEMIRLFRDLSRFSDEGGGVVAVMDASFLKLAKVLFSIEGIPVDVKRNLYKTGNLGVYLRSMAVRTWGEINYLYDGAFSGMEVVNQMRYTLESGKSVFMCPAGTGSEAARWRSGIGYLVREIFQDGIEDEIGVGLIAAGGGEYVILPFPSLADLFGREFVEETPNSRLLAVDMQKLSEGMLMVS